MMIGKSINTDEVLKRLTSCYKENFKARFNEYLLDLEFTTVLVYYSGICAIVAEFISLPHVPVRTRMCIMIDYDRNDLCELKDEVLERIIAKEILEKYEGFFYINRELCSRYFGRRICIKNASFKEPVLSIKLEKEEMILELNGQIIRSLGRGDKDFLGLVASLNRYCEHQFIQ